MSSNAQKYQRKMELIKILTENKDHNSKLQTILNFEKNYKWEPAKEDWIELTPKKTNKAMVKYYQDSLNEQMPYFEEKERQDEVFEQVQPSALKRQKAMLHMDDNDGYSTDTTLPLEDEDEDVHMDNIGLLSYFISELVACNTQSTNFAHTPKEMAKIVHTLYDHYRKRGDENMDIIETTTCEHAWDMFYEQKKLENENIMGEDEEISNITYRKTGGSPAADGSKENPIDLTQDRMENQEM